MESVYENRTTAKSLILKEHRTESEIERVSYDDGIQLYIKGCQFPQKSCPTPEAIIAVNTVKRTMVSFLNAWLIPLSKKRLIRSFNRINYDVMGHYFLKPKYMTKFSRELKILIYEFLINWGIDEEMAQQTSKIVSHIFEYDNAYRYRLQDILQAANWEKLTSRNEWRRLVGLLYERDDIESRKIGGDRRVGKQFIKAVNLASLLLYLPSFRKALSSAVLKANRGSLLMDDSDIYWSYLRTDYNFDGLTYEQRMREYNRRGFKLPITK